MSVFETWVYNYDELENILNSDDYFQVISLDFKSSYIKGELEKILNKYLDFGKFEKYRILSLLYQALRLKKDLPDILREFYNMYCHGYSFFEDLGLGYGLTCEVPPINYKAEMWDDLTEQAKNHIIDSFFPQIENDINRAIDWIENDKIILTGTKSELHNWEFIDNRNDEEKKSTIWVIVPNDDTLEHKVRIDNKKQFSKKWWMFWKK